MFFFVVVQMIVDIKLATNKYSIDIMLIYTWIYSFICNYC